MKMTNPALLKGKELLKDIADKNDSAIDPSITVYVGLVASRLTFPTGETGRSITLLGVANYVGKEAWEAPTPVNPDFDLSFAGCNIHIAEIGRQGPTKLSSEVGSLSARYPDGEIYDVDLQAQISLATHDYERVLHEVNAWTARRARQREGDDLSVRLAVKAWAADRETLAITAVEFSDVYRSPWWQKLDSAQND